MGKEKKEIGKLLELLKEFSPEDFNWFERDGKIYDRQEIDDEADVLVEMGVYIISKQFGFIKWLVENEKIDLETALIGLESNDRTSYTETEELLMLLSIQDEPINFLISILK